jgi:hypothetical protein
MDSHLLAVLPVSTSQLSNLWRKLRWIHGLRALRGEPTTIKIRVDRCRVSQTTWRDSNSSTTLVYPSYFSRKGIWHLNWHAQRRSAAFYFSSLPLPSIKERTSFTTKSIDRHAPGLRAPGETRATYNRTTRVRRTLSQSAQKRPLPPLRKPITTRVGPTGPVEDAYYKKSWLRTLAVLGD